MKKILVTVVCVCLGVFSAMSQNIEDFFAQQKDKEGVEYAEITGEAIEFMNLVSKIADLASIFDSDIKSEDAQILKLISGILDDVEKVEFVVAKDKNVDLQKAFKQSKVVQKSHYKLLGQRSSEKESVSVYTQKSKDKVVKNIIVLLSDKEKKTTFVSNIAGEIKLEKIGELIDFAEKN